MDLERIKELADISLKENIKVGNRLTSTSERLRAAEDVHDAISKSVEGIEIVKTVTNVMLKLKINGKTVFLDVVGYSSNDWNKIIRGNK